MRARLIDIDKRAPRCAGSERIHSNRPVEKQDDNDIHTILIIDYLVFLTAAPTIITQRNTKVIHK